MKKFYSNVSGFLICLIVVIMLPLCIYMGLYLENMVFKIILGVLVFICSAISLVIILGNIPGGFIHKRKQNQNEKIKYLEERIEKLEKKSK